MKLITGKYEGVVKWLMVLIVTICAFLQLVDFISGNFMNLPASGDQFGYYTPFYEEMNIFKGFFYQHGSHFLGLGYIVSLITANIFGFSIGGEGYAIVFLMVINTALALGLKQKLFKRIEWSDLFLPLLFINPLYSEVYLNVAHASVVALPLLSILVLAHLLLLDNPGRKTLYLGMLFFFSAFTGYAFLVSALIGLYTIYLLISTRDRQVHILLLLAELVTLALFISLYNFDIPGRTACLLKGEEILYLSYGLNLFRSFFHAMGDPKWLWMGAGGLFILLIFAALINRRKLSARTGIIVLSLFLFSLFYLVLNVYARSCLGPNAAYASRYAPFFIPAFLAVYFILTLPGKSVLIRNSGIFLFVLVFSFFRLRPNDPYYSNIERFSTKIKKWYECYDENPDPAYCTDITGVSPSGKSHENIGEKIKKHKILLNNRKE